LNNKIYLKRYYTNDSVIVLNSKKSTELGLNKIKYGYISFGLKKQQVDIKISDEVKDEQILIPNFIFRTLCLPEYVDYEVSVVNNTINLGPLIGVIVDENHVSITKNRLKKLLNLTIKYTQINGAIVVFALDKVDKSNLDIEGYCYNPKSNIWAKGTFPYPSSLYTTVIMSSEWRNHFISLIGNKLFNDKSLNEWEMYSLLSSRNDIKNPIPHMVLYESFEDAYNFIKKYSKVFIKPLENNALTDFVQIAMKDGRFIFKVLHEEKYSEFIAKGSAEAANYANSILSSKKHILCQPSEMLKYDGKTTNIRVFMQKNSDLQWINSGMFGRCGNELEIVSGIKGNVKIARTELLLKNTLSLTDQEINNVKKKIVSICKSVCETIDESGLNYGNVEFDIAMENSNNIKIFRINSSNPDFKIALKIKERVLFYNIKSMPMFYAKSLAGFKA
jgi:hypothetical protein